MSSNNAPISRIPIILMINGNSAVKGEFIRYLSPLTIKKLIENFPLQNRINKFDNKFVYIKVDLDLGTEKAKNAYKKGDIAFSPSGSSVYVFINDHNHNQPLNHIGKITTMNLDILSRVSVGDYLIIDRDE